MTSTRVSALLGCLVSFALTSVAGPAARADIDPLSGVDFVTITHRGNAPWAGSGALGDSAIGRGSVDHEYRIGRFEVTTAQFVEFFNAALDRPPGDRLPHLIPPDFWGAVPTTPHTPGGLRWTVPVGNEMRPVADISWRMAAMYCNFLHNNKATNREAFLSGAYDVSTFSYTGTRGDIFTDQLERSPGARYFIPTWDEWLKAAHWSPDKNGPGQPGYYLYPNSSDTPLMYGPPGVGQANAGYHAADNSQYQVLLGSYSAVQSPWGLLDVAGETAEWTESILTLNDGRRYRVFDGSHWVTQIFDPAHEEDWLGGRGADFPSIPINTYGFRLASVIPLPSVSMMLGAAIPILVRRQKRGRSCTDGSNSRLRRSSP